MGDSDHHAAFLEMGIVQDLSSGQAGASRHASGAQLGHDLVLGPGERPLLHQAIDLIFVFAAPARIRPIWVAYEVSAIERAQEGIPHVGAYRLNIDVDIIIGPPWLAAE